MEGGSEITGFGRPFGLGFGAEGRLHVTDMDLHAVFRFNPDFGGVEMLDTKEDGWKPGSELGRQPVKKARPRNRGHFNGPHSIAFGSEGRLFITTYYTPAVHVHDADSRFLFCIGDSNSAHPLEGPATAFFDHSGRLLVSEYAQNALLAFDEAGGFQGQVGKGTDGFDRLHMCRPCPDGRLVVADTWNHRLQRFTADGEWDGWLGLPEDGERANGWSHCSRKAVASGETGGFNAPVAVDFYSCRGLMLVTDWGNNRLVMFDLQGKPLKTLDGLNLEKPYDARFFGNGIVAADSHNGRVLILGGAAKF